MWSIPQWLGDKHEEVLANLHRILQPETYLEIGVAQGRTMAIARCKSIGIDPSPELEAKTTDNKPFCSIYNMTSDRFFKYYSPMTILGGPIELAFLDGLHYYEFLLRDFINVEKYAKHNSVICLHDCLPYDEHVGRRDWQDTTFANEASNVSHWAGDVWKTLLILRTYRPDLKIWTVNAPPTGLVMITDLNPLSTVLSESYFNIVEEFRETTLLQSWQAAIQPEHVLPTDVVNSLSSISQLFWL